MEERSRSIHKKVVSIYEGGVIEDRIIKGSEIARTWQLLQESGLVGLVVEYFTNCFRAYPRDYNDLPLLRVFLLDSGLARTDPVSQVAFCRDRLHGISEPRWAGKKTGSAARLPAVSAESSVHVATNSPQTSRSVGMDNGLGRSLAVGTNQISVLASLLTCRDTSMAG